MKNVLGKDIFFEYNRKIEILRKTYTPIDEMGVYVIGGGVMIDIDKYVIEYCYIRNILGKIIRVPLFNLNFI